MRIADTQTLIARRRHSRKIDPTSGVAFGEYFFGAEYDMAWDKPANDQNDAPAPPAPYSSAYVTQFIHQEIMDTGRHIDPPAKLANKYQTANQNMPIPKIAKISV